MSRRWVAVPLTVALAGAACGARVGPYVGGAATETGGGQAPAAGGQSQAVTGPQTSTGIGAGGPVTTVAGSVGSGGAILPGAGGSQQPGASAPDQLTQDNFPFDPAAQAALCQGTAGNTASDKGVTPTSITVGNVSGLTGVLLNNFNQGPEAVQALFKAVNAAGGICGRKLNLLVEDDGQDSTKDAADIADEIPKVLAFVGSTSDADNGGVPEMEQAKVPDLGPAISANRGASSMFWAPSGATQYVRNGHIFLYDSLTNGLKAFNDFPTRIATLAYQIPISEQAAKEFNSLFVRAGATSCFTDYTILPTTTQLDGDVIQMKNHGCTGVYTTMDVTGNAKLYQAMSRQSFKPPFNGTTFDGYTPAQIQVAGQDKVQGLQVTLPFLPFNEGNTIIERYLAQLRTWEPGKDPSGFGMAAWAGAEMFIYGLLKAGRNPTRASLVNVFSTINSWSTGGATSPDTPRLRLPSGPCIVQTAVKGNDFFRAWPASAFYCNGALVDLGPVPS